MASTAEYWVGETIGEGAFGVVVHGRHKTTNLDVAIKCITKHALKKSRYCRELGQAVVQEQRILKTFKDCQYIVNLYASFHDAECVYIVTECCQGGTLKDLIEQQQKGLTDRTITTEKESQCWKAHYALQLLEGISHLHAGNIVHCDIKPENLILTDKGRLKIADFGCAIDVDRVLDIPRGTTAYSAPELVKKKSTISVAVDLWSMACVWYALWSMGQSPFDSSDSGDAQIVQGMETYCALDADKRSAWLFDDKGESTTAATALVDLWKQLIASLLHPVPAERLGASDTKVDSAKDMYPSIRKSLVWKGVDLEQDPNVLPESPKWWKEANKDKIMRDGGQGWSVFLV